MQYGAHFSDGKVINSQINTSHCAAEHGQTKKLAMVEEYKASKNITSHISDLMQEDSLKPCLQDGICDVNAILSNTLPLDVAVINTGCCTIQEQSDITKDVLLMYQSKTNDSLQKNSISSTCDNLSDTQGMYSVDDTAANVNICASNVVETIIQKRVSKQNEKQTIRQISRADMTNYIDNSFLSRKLWKCRLCNKIYMTKENLITHMITHCEAGKDSGFNLEKCPIEKQSVDVENKPLLFSPSITGEGVHKNSPCSSCEQMPTKRCTPVHEIAILECLPKHNEINTFSQLNRASMNDYIDNSYITKKYGCKLWQCRKCVKRYTTKYNFVTHMLTHSKTGKCISSNIFSHELQQKTEGGVKSAMLFNSNKISEVFQKNNPCSTFDHLPMEQNCSSTEASSTKPDLFARGIVDGAVVAEYVPRHNEIVTLSQLYGAAMNNYIENSYITKKYGRKFWQCRICVKRYTNKDNFVTHMLTHSKTGKLIDLNFKSHKIQEKTKGIVNRALFFSSSKISEVFQKKNACSTSEHLPMEQNYSSPEASSTKPDLCARGTVDGTVVPVYVPRHNGIMKYSQLYRAAMNNYIDNSYVTKKYGCKLWQCRKCVKRYTTKYNFVTHMLTHSKTGKCIGSNIFSHELQQKTEGGVKSAMLFNSNKISEVFQKNDAGSTFDHLPMEQNCSSTEASSTKPDLFARGIVDGAVVAEYVPRHNEIGTFSQLYGAAMNNYIENSYITKKYGRKFWQCRICVKRYTNKDNFVTHMLTHFKTGKLIDSNFKSHKIQEKTKVIVNRALFFSSSKISEVFQKKNACSTSEHLPMEQNYSSPEASSTKPDLCARGTVDGTVVPEYVPRHNGIMKYSQLYRAAMNNYIDNSYVTKKYGRKLWQCRKCVKRYTTKYNFVTHMLTHSKTGKCIGSNIFSHELQQKTEGGVKSAMLFNSNKISEVFQKNDAGSTFDHLPMEQNCSSTEASSTKPDLFARGIVDGAVVAEYVPRHNEIVTFSKLYGAAMNNYIENSYITKKYGRKFWQCRICVKRYTNKDNFVTHMLTHSKTGKCIGSNIFSHELQQKTEGGVKSAVLFNSNKISEVIQENNACSTSEHLPMEQNCSSTEVYSTKPDLCARGTVDGTVVLVYVPRHNEIMKFSQLYREVMNNYIDNSYMTKKYGRRFWQCRMCVKRYTTKYNVVTHMLTHSKTGKFIDSNFKSHKIQEKTEGVVNRALFFSSSKISEVLQENNACSTSEHLPIEQNCSSPEASSTNPDLCAHGTVDGIIIPEYVPRHNAIVTFSQLYRAAMNNYIDNSYITKKYGRKLWQCRICVKRYTTKYNFVTHMLTHSETGKLIDSNFKSHKIQEKTEGVVNRALFFSSSKISEIFQKKNACSTSEHLPMEQNCSSTEASSTNPDLCARDTVEGTVPVYVPRHNEIMTFSQLYRAAMNNYIDNSYITKKYGRRFWQCRKCAKRYTTKYNFVTHMLTHS
ncbi:uncharacterized protein LOC133346481 [Lethenteron reissneri]|uniref:uncharacterized protein LOC133346481 n=1 Tax=Lethenteron reissneri TaxID=7753 RepID=UPI002AB7900C|nr:uncharacterized protein LOC133346481 [Lethenteron reissneri]